MGRRTHYTHMSSARGYFERFLGWSYLPFREVGTGRGLGIFCRICFACRASRCRSAAMLFWSIRSVVLSAKDNKIRKAGEELIGRLWQTGRRISFHRASTVTICSRSHKPGSDRGGPGHMLDRCPHRGSGQKDSRDTRKYPGGRDARPGLSSLGPCIQVVKEAGGDSGP